MIQVHFVEFEFEQHGLEAPPSYQHCPPSSYHSYLIYPWWEKPQ